ncbi:hypothetical protein [Streptomyces sp. NPDC094437]|uniref:hypothetical protein n=1 Tax=Streptomyces sp. NPDC094437 TaxID=3366060 RepID=UPI003828DE5A
MVRGTSTKGLWAAGATAVVVLGLTGYMMFRGGGDNTEGKGGGGASPTVSASASFPATPGPTYTVPRDWTEPERWTALPASSRTDSHGNKVGYPHTTDGAVAVLVASNDTEVTGSRTLADEQLDNYYSYMGKGSQSEETKKGLEQLSESADAEARGEMGLPAKGDLPEGAYMRNTTVGYKIVNRSDDEIGAWLLSRYAVKAGTSSKEEVTYSRTLLAVHWEGDDGWKITGPAMTAVQNASGGQDKPAIVAPGDEKFNSAGWTALRAAS